MMTQRRNMSYQLTPSGGCIPPSNARTPALDRLWARARESAILLEAIGILRRESIPYHGDAKCSRTDAVGQVADAGIRARDGQSGMLPSVAKAGPGMVKEQRRQGDGATPDW